MFVWKDKNKLNWAGMALFKKIKETHNAYIDISVTRSGDLLDFGQLLNAFGNT